LIHFSFERLVNRNPFFYAGLMVICVFEACGH